MSKTERIVAISIFGIFSILVDAIYAKGLQADSNEYDIPTKYSAELINIQLKLLEKVLPRRASKNSATSKAVNVAPSKPATVAPSKPAIVAPSKPATVAPSKPATLPAAKKEQSAPMPSTSQAANSKDSSNLAKKQKLSERNIRDYIPVVVEKGRMASKLERAAPYNMFLTAITDSKPTHQEPLSITLQEILDESLGEIESSVQINFMVDIGWLLGHYYFAGIL